MTIKKKYRRKQRTGKGVRVKHIALALFYLSLALGVVLLGGYAAILYISTAW